VSFHNRLTDCQPQSGAAESRYNWLHYATVAMVMQSPASATRASPLPPVVPHHHFPCPVVPPLVPGGFCVRQPSERQEIYRACGSGNQARTQQRRAVLSISKKLIRAA
jgi:hypothetical protein